MTKIDELEDGIEPYMEDTYKFMFSVEDFDYLKKTFMIRLEFDIVILEEKSLTTAAIAHHINDLYKGDIVCIYSDQNAPKSIINMHIKRQDNQTMEDEELDMFLQEVFKNLQMMPICGIYGIDKVFMMKDPIDFDKWILETEGTNFAQILSLENIDRSRTMSNCPPEVNQVLGIEAARQSIINEIRTVMDRYGISVQYRHLALLADVITHNGYLMAISRHGINRIATGPLSKATFEEMADMLIEAAAGAKTDDLNGISARIILGLKGKCGTGSFDLYYPASLSKNDQIETFKTQLEEFKAEQNKKQKINVEEVGDLHEATTPTTFTTQTAQTSRSTQRTQTPRQTKTQRTQTKNKNAGPSNPKKHKMWDVGGGMGGGMGGSDGWSGSSKVTEENDEVVANYLNRSPEYYNDNDYLNDIGSIQRENQEKDPFDYL